MYHDTQECYFAEFSQNSVFSQIFRQLFFLYYYYFFYKSEHIRSFYSLFVKKIFAHDTGPRLCLKIRFFLARILVASLDTYNVVLAENELVEQQVLIIHVLMGMGDHDDDVSVQRNYRELAFGLFVFFQGQIILIVYFYTGSIFY